MGRSRCDAQFQAPALGGGSWPRVGGRRRAGPAQRRAVPSARRGRAGLRDLHPRSRRDPGDLDRGGSVASWNAGAERMKGYRAGEIVGQHFSRFYPPERIAAGWPEHELEQARTTGRFEDEGWRIRKDGSRFWANVVITAVHDEAGQLRGFAKVTRDLTERRRIETLEAEGKQINEFLAMLGHELRNPLAPIRNAVAVMGAKGTADPTTA